MEDLRDFMERVKELGEPRVIEGANWDLEIGAAAYFGAKARNPSALLFDRIKDFPPGYRMTFSKRRGK